MYLAPAFIMRTTLIYAITLYILVLAATFTDAFTLKDKLHHRMTKRELQTFFGVDTHDQVPDYDVAIPYQGDPRSGDFASYKLDNHVRHRRSVEPNVWYFNIQALGLNLNLNLSKTRNVIGPKVQVETNHKNGSISYRPRSDSNILEGHVDSEPGSFAVLNNNGGLTGMIGLLDQLLFIHPLPSHLAKHYGNQNGGGQPHVVYRHPADDVTNAKRSCHVEDSKVKRSIPRSRSRRSVDEHAQSSSNKVMELAFIADKYVVEHKGDEKKVEEFLTMVAHIVERMYRDPSVGDRKIHVEVVKITLDKDNKLNYKSKDSNRHKIDKLAEWGVQNIVVDDGKYGHADILVLITRGGGGGLAMGSSTCKSRFGLTVNTDIGLATAMIAAHEIAHTLGVSHDGGKPECPNHVYLMATSVTSGKKAMGWSVCSKAQIQEFLQIRYTDHKQWIEVEVGFDKIQRMYEHWNSNLDLDPWFATIEAGPASSCLDNEAPKLGFAVEGNSQLSKEYYRKLPGQVFDGKAQCELQYGPGHYHCQQRKSDCGRLFCTTNGFECHSLIAPPMDGTRCGERHWCIKGECVDDGSPMIDGEWSTWSDYTNCSRSCGGGLKWRTRTCTNPKPQAGGKDCEGSEKGHNAICNSQDCPKGSKDFRDSQCEAKNPGSRNVFTSNPCQLSCLKISLLYNYGHAAAGSRCSGDPRLKHMCAQGRCLPAGCDNKLYSGVEHDRCGVCGGDSSTCSVVKDEYTKDWRGWGPGEPDKIADVPVGSSNVLISMRGLTRHLLGVQDAKKHYLYKVGYTWSTVVKAAGTKVSYEHEDQVYKDKIFIRGPTTEPLKIVYVGFMSKNPGVDYEYFAPIKSVVTPKQVYWNTTNWSLCTEKCAGGIEARSVRCLRKDDNSWISDSLCVKSSKKPEASRKCNTKPCSPSWYQSSWRPCSQTCGRGKQIREIVCRQKVAAGKYKTLIDDKCNLDNKPKGLLEKDCNRIVCPAEWIPTKWSKCSASCGPKGLMQRKLKCKRLNEEGVYAPVGEKFCHSAAGVPTTGHCNTDVNCPETMAAPGGKKFMPVGCFQDFTGDRAVPEMVANLRKEINWFNLPKTVQECAEKVRQKNSTYKVFSVQFYGECWSGDSAERTYAEYGSSKNCWKGVGGSRSNYVYTFV